MCKANSLNSHHGRCAISNYLSSVISNLFLFHFLGLCLCLFVVDFFFGWLFSHSKTAAKAIALRALTFLNWWALITQSAHIPHIIHLMNKEIVCYWNARYVCYQSIRDDEERDRERKKTTAFFYKNWKKIYLYICLVFLKH